MLNAKQKLAAALVCLLAVLGSVTGTVSYFRGAAAPHRILAATTGTESGTGPVAKHAPTHAGGGSDAISAVTTSTNGLALATDKLIFNQVLTDLLASGVVELDDFCTGGAYTTGAASIPNGVLFGSLQWRANLGTGAAIAHVTTAQDATHQCIIQLDAGTTAGSKANGIRAPTATVGGRTLSSTQKYVFGTTVRVPTPSDATNTFALRVGLSGASGETADGIYIEGDNNASANWHCKACNASTCSTDSGAASVAISANTWYHPSFTYDGSGTPTVTCLVDGTTIGTITTNLPTAALSDSISNQGIAGTGANRKWLMDWTGIYHSWSTNRAQ